MSRAQLLLIEILTAVALNAGAQLLLRLGARSGITAAGRTIPQVVLDVALRPPIIVGLLRYGLSVLVWIWVLSRAEASFAYPFLGLGLVLVMLAGHLWLGEALSTGRVIATALITTGVIVMARSCPADKVRHRLHAVSISAMACLLALAGTIACQAEPEPKPTPEQKMAQRYPQLATPVSPARCNGISPPCGCSASMG